MRTTITKEMRRMFPNGRFDRVYYWDTGIYVFSIMHSSGKFPVREAEGATPQQALDRLDEYVRVNPIS